MRWIGLDSTDDVCRDDLPDALAFCDSTGDHLLRVETDVELSHWYPNHTPTEYRADTSTEMVLRFVTAHRDHEHVGVGMHCDTDAALSLFSLVEPEVATAHAELLARTAEAGDFGFWLDDAAARLYGAVRAAWEPRPGDTVTTRFDRSLAAIAAALAGAGDDGDETARIQAASDALIGHGVTRVTVDDRLTAYVVDDALAADHLAALDRTPRFDQPVTAAWASHRVRNRLDRERLQLLSIPADDSDGGWHHSLWYPQYLPWDTSTLWRPDGLEYTGSRLEWRYRNARLDDAVAALGWERAPHLAPWAPQFPLLAWSAAPSSVTPDHVADRFAGCWA